MRWSLLLLLSVAQLMVILDISAVNVALPDLSADLGIARGEIGWTITSYSLILGSLLLFGGRAADLLGRRRVFLTGLGVFTASSLMTAVAGDATTLFGARAGQGLGAAMLSPAALSIITTGFHGPQRAKALGVWGAVGGAGAAIGVLLGGALTELVDWRAIFFINLHRACSWPPAPCTSSPPTARGRAGAASTCAVRSSPPPASASSSMPSRRLRPPAGPRCRRSVSAPRRSPALPRSPRWSCAPGSRSCASSGSPIARSAAAL
jgi:MFS family permease